MQSEDRVQSVMKPLAASMSTFRSALATTLEQIRGILATGRQSKNGQVERFAAELGDFAANRIDAARFAALFRPDNSLNTVNVQRIDRAYQTMSELMSHGDDLFLVNVAEGGNLRDSVAKTLEHLGTAFGSARVVELSRTGRYRLSEHAKYFSSFPFAQWNATERRIAPPLVVMVDGKDLNVAGLAEFLDGALKIVLVVRGSSSPAPLVRLITPNTFVAQAAEHSALERLARWQGPGIAALMPETAARFVHDPGAEGSEPFTVDFLPEPKLLKPLGGISASQQTEELEQLKALCESARVAMAGAGTTAKESASGTADPADKLAAWLLQQADLTDVG